MENTTIEEYQALAKDASTIFNEKNCPMTAAMKIISGKWKFIILNLISLGAPIRFTSLKKKISGITQSVLTMSLRELEADGIIERKVFPEAPPRVEYSLTAKGKTLEPILKTLCKWGWENRLRHP